jgi:hypothetical protein
MLKFSTFSLLVTVGTASAAEMVQAISESDIKSLDKKEWVLKSPTADCSDSIKLNITRTNEDKKQKAFYYTLKETTKANLGVAAKDETSNSVFVMSKKKQSNEEKTDLCANGECVEVTTKMSNNTLATSFYLEKKADGIKVGLGRMIRFNLGSQEMTSSWIVKGKGNGQKISQEVAVCNYVPKPEEEPAAKTAVNDSGRELIKDVDAPKSETPSEDVSGVIAR